MGRKADLQELARLMLRAHRELKWGTGELYNSVLGTHCVLGALGHLVCRMKEEPVDSKFARLAGLLDIVSYWKWNLNIVKANDVCQHDFMDFYNAIQEYSRMLEKVKSGTIRKRYC